MHWSFWYELRGPVKLWAASISFLVIGVLITFGIPAVMEQTQDRANVVPLARVLGGAFIVLGLAVLIPMLLTLRLAKEQRESWHWWINLVGGLLGALAFAVPAALMFPVFFVAYILRPNPLIPDQAAAVNNLGIAALFSVIGVVVLGLLYIIVPKMVRKRKNPLEWNYQQEK